METISTQPDPNIPLTQRTTRARSYSTSPLRMKFGKVKGIEVLSFKEVDLEKTFNEGGTKFLDVGLLQVLYFEQYDRFVLSLNSWNYVLLKRIPITSSGQSAPGPVHYNLPTFEGFYTLKLNKIPQVEALQNFETILMHNSKFSRLELQSSVRNRMSLQNRLGRQVEPTQGAVTENMVQPLSDRGESGQLTRKDKIKRGTKKVAFMLTKGLMRKGKYNLNFNQTRDIESIKRTNELMAPVHLVPAKDVEKWITISKDMAHQLNFEPEIFLTNQPNKTTSPVVGPNQTLSQRIFDDNARDYASRTAITQTQSQLFQPLVDRNIAIPIGTYRGKVNKYIYQNNTPPRFPVLVDKLSEPPISSSTVTMDNVIRDNTNKMTEIENVIIPQTTSQFVRTIPTYQQESSVSVPQYTIANMETLSAHQSIGNSHDPQRSVDMMKYEKDLQEDEGSHHTLESYKLTKCQVMNSTPTHNTRTSSGCPLTLNEKIEFVLLGENQQGQHIGTFPDSSTMIAGGQNQIQEAHLQPLSMGSNKQDTLAYSPENQNILSSIPVNIGNETRSIETGYNAIPANIGLNTLESKEETGRVSNIILPNNQNLDIHTGISQDILRQESMPEKSPKGLIERLKDKFRGSRQDQSTNRPDEIKKELRVIQSHLPPETVQGCEHLTHGEA